MIFSLSILQVFFFFGRPRAELKRSYTGLIYRRFYSLKPFLIPTYSDFRTLSDTFGHIRTFSDISGLPLIIHPISFHLVPSRSISFHLVPSRSDIFRHIPTYSDIFRHSKAVSYPQNFLKPGKSIDNSCCVWLPKYLSILLLTKPINLSVWFVP